MLNTVPLPQPCSSSPIGNAQGQQTGWFYRYRTDRRTDKCRRHRQRWRSSALAARLFRQQEVLHAEHGFLHFTGVTHTGQQYFALGDWITAPSELVPSRSVHIRSLERSESLPPSLSSVVSFRTNKQVTAKQVLPGSLGGHFNRQVMLPDQNPRARVTREACRAGPDILPRVPTEHRTCRRRMGRLMLPQSITSLLPPALRR